MEWKEPNEMTTIYLVLVKSCFPLISSKWRISVKILKVKPLKIKNQQREILQNNIPWC